MTWNQPPKKLVTPACVNSMAFVKPYHGNDPDIKSPILKHSTFDPCQPQHRTSNMDAVKKLSTSAENSFPCTGLQQFWRSKIPVCSETASVEYTKSLSSWSHVIFSHANVSSTMQLKFFIPTIVTGFAKRGLIRAFINIEKSRFEILITVYLDNVWCLVYQLLHQSIVMQGNSAGALFDGLLAELPAILDSFSPVPQVNT